MGKGASGSGPSKGKVQRCPAGAKRGVALSLVCSLPVARLNSEFALDRNHPRSRLGSGSSPGNGGFGSCMSFSEGKWQELLDLSIIEGKNYNVRSGSASSQGNLVRVEIATFNKE
eukprot:scaffold346_cov116-Cylindrotheca_fusiformis.AAC.11